MLPTLIYYLKKIAFQGLVVYSDPPSGCPSMARAPNVTNPVGQWIALVRRYDCNFEDKIRNAQLAGYDAVIVHNVNSSDLGN
jgi:hypothetical protein